MILRHPVVQGKKEILVLGYKISKGSGNPQFVQADIAVIKVDENGKPMYLLRSACLPKPNNNVEDAFHAGWSEPPPLQYVEKEASGYSPYYRLDVKHYSKQ